MTLRTLLTSWLPKCIISKEFTFRRNQIQLKLKLLRNDDNWQQSGHAIEIFSNHEAFLYAQGKHVHHTSKEILIKE